MSLALTSIQETRVPKHGEIAQQPHPRTPHNHRPPPISSALVNYREQEEHIVGLSRTQLQPIQAAMTQDIEEEYRRFRSFVERRRQQ